MQKRDVEIQMTGDGSNTLFVKDLGEHYHSWHGAIRESMHVFINEGLQQCRFERIDLLEVGFGTGLNALLTCLAALQRGVEVHYDTLELYPLEPEVIEQLNYPWKLGGDTQTLFNRLHQAGWDQFLDLNPFFRLHKIRTDFTGFQPRKNYGLVYFDAFAPEKQPEMWEEKPLRNLYNALVPGGILVTYCAKGMIKRLLRDIGFEVASLPGPPGKREMIRAVRTD